MSKGKPSKGENNMIILLITVCIIIVCVILFAVINGTVLKKETGSEVSVVNDEAAADETEAPTEATTEEIIDLSVEPVELNDELRGYISTLNTNLRSYYDENYDSGNILTVCGYMYYMSDEGSNLQLQVEDVYEGEVPEVLKDVNLLYIKSGDFDFIDGIDDMEIDVDLTDEYLSPFTSILTTEGYFISSDQYGGGVLSAEDYTTLIMRYNIYNGEVRNLSSSSNNDAADYANIYSKISKEWGDGYTPDIKWAAVDDKYGVAVANVLESPTEFKEFLFLKSGNSWSVKSKDLANKTYVKQFVNEKYPNMNLDLLPSYNLSEYDDFKTDLYGYYDSIVDLEGLDITEDDLPAVYCLSCDNFIYYEFENEKRVLGYLDDENNLTFYPISSVVQAVNQMGSLSDNPPVFIIKFS